ncbi:NAD(P)H-dependent glycerol-3-phosphate dehydrogenase [Mesobacterium pallidum]|uniref:NAD(P)H-dependent glycerol-3-phosphate dehydrogenase n=1 Tax=Mesobacterium pallidum TaxID=2872037 RepID=UPI001EE23E61|nr:NAD(P)H-dependent glycerol-3-phosphate dehydrogenase [Mesobacterium pallidum]
MSVGVLGAGAFGTALAISLARGGAETVLWARDADLVQTMAETRANPRLPGAPLPETLRVTADIRTATACDILLVVVPTQKVRDLAVQYRDMLDGKTLVACCKGIELTSHLGPVALLDSLLPHARTAILTGPSFAHDIAIGLPTALTLACADEVLGEALQTALTTPNLRLYRTTDTVGAELGGALKNVMAIAAGACMGAGLGDSARAALMTRGYAEMTRMAAALGAQPETLAGLSGFGDLVLTCTSEGSRNYRFGLSLGRGEDFDPSVTVEGAATARAALAWAQDHDIDMPITRAITALLDGELDVTEAVQALLSRPLRPEQED